MKKLNYTLLQFFLCIYVIELVYPPITVLFPSVYVVLGCMFGWLFVSFSAYPEYYLNCSRRLLLILFCYVYVSILPRVAGNGILANRYMGMPLVFFGSIIYDFHKTTGTLKIIRNTIIVAALFSLLTAFTTIEALIVNPYISRSIKSSGEHSANLAAMGIGGYTFIYYAAMLAPVLLHVILTSKKAALKIAMLACLTLVLYLIFKSSYMTALMIVFVSSITYALNAILNTSQNRGAKLCLFLFGVAAICFVTPFIFKTVLPLLPPRIQQIFENDESQSFMLSLYEEFVVDRWPEWQESFAAVRQSPLLGIAVSGVVATSKGFITGFGQHSFLLDTFALFGLIVGTLICLIAFFPISLHTATTGLNNKQKTLRSAIVVATVIMYLFNNVTDSIAFVSSLFYLYVRDQI